MLREMWLVEFRREVGLPYAAIVDAESALNAVTVAAQRFGFDESFKGIEVRSTKILVPCGPSGEMIATSVS